MPSRPLVCLGRWHRLGDDATVLPVVQDRPTAAQGLAPAGPVPPGVATTGPALRTAPRHQLGPSPPRRLQEAVKKRGEETGPSPVDRAKCGTALHLACDARAMPLGVMVTGVNANDGIKTQK